MSTRIDRFQCAIYLAQLILEGNEAHDDLRIEQALQDVRIEVEAGRRNIAEMPLLAARVLRLFGQDEHSVKAPLRVVADLPDVTEPEFELLAYSDGRDKK